MEDDIEKQNRILLRPWLENMLAIGKIHGLVWHDPEKTMFRVPWKHRSKKDWSIEHCSVFVEWAKNTGRWSDYNGTPNFAQLKTRLRCAFNKAPDIEEMKELHCNHGEEPYKVYRFKTRKDVSLRKIRHKASLQNSWSQLSKTSEIENLNKYEDSFDESVCTENSSEGLIHERSFAGCEFEEKIVPTRRNDIGMSISNSFSTKTRYDDDQWTTEAAKKLELNKPSTNTPFIPLSVELLAASSSSDSGSERGSPTDLGTFQLPDVSSAVSHNDQTSSVHNSKEVFDNVLNTQKFEEPSQVLLGQSTSMAINKETRYDSLNHEVFPMQLSSKEHMLQVASLFVEAGEKITQEVSRSSASTLQATGDTGLSELQNYVLVAPTKDEEELRDATYFSSSQVFTTLPQLHCESVQKSYNGGTESAQKSCDDDISFDRLDQGQMLQSAVDAVDLTCKSYHQQACSEPIDLTKKAVATQFRPKSSQSHQVCAEIWKLNDEEDTNKDIVNTILKDIDFEDLNFLPTDTIEDIRIKTKRGEQILVSKAKLLCQWEERLKRWEAELIATERACFWKNKFFDMELSKKCISINNNQFQQNLIHAGNDNLESSSKLMLPGDDYLRLGLGLQSNSAVQVFPETVQALFKTNSNAMSTRQLTNGASVSPRKTSTLHINSTGPGGSGRPSKRKCDATMVDNSVTETCKKTSNSPRRKKLCIDPVGPAALPQFSFQNHVTDASFTELQPSFVVLPSVVCKVDPDNNWLCSKNDTVCSKNDRPTVCKEVTGEDYIDESKSISDSKILDCARLVPETTNERSLSLSTASISSSSLLGHVSPTAVVNSPVEESPGVTLSEPSERPADFRRAEFTNSLSASSVVDGRDSDCETDLVIETSDEEEKLIEEGGKEVLTSSKSCMNSRCSDQDRSENEEQNLLTYDKQIAKANDSLVKSRTLPVLNNAAYARAGSSQDDSLVNLSSKVFNTSNNSGNQSHVGHSLEEFTEWLRRKTRILCEEASKSTVNDFVSHEEPDSHCTGNSLVIMTQKRE